MDKDTEIQLLKEENALLKEENKNLLERIVVLEKLVKDLLTELSKHAIKKNSKNSNLPPSSDLSRKNQSLRKPSDRPSGGQKGHKGSTLTMTANPDKTIPLIPDYCNECGADLIGIEPKFKSKRQVIELPPVHPIYIEYQSYSKTCTCGHKQLGNYPEGVTNHIQYGASIIALVGYLSVYQYLSFKRLQGLLQHFFHLHLSQGSIDNMLKRLGTKATPIYDAIQRKIENSQQVGADETGAKVNGNKWWIWTWQNTRLTFISASISRGQATIEKLFPNGFPNAVLGSDMWRPHLNTHAKEHQLCIAHILRALDYLIELEKTSWADNMKELLLKALQLKKLVPHYSRGHPHVQEIENAMDILMDELLDKSQTPKTLNLQKSMKKYRHSIFTFLYYAEVPADNNGSERAIRNIKVKQKVSGQFKSGQDAFCRIRSVIDTALKNNCDVFQTLKIIALLKE